jgi:hypothetical protein
MKPAPAVKVTPKAKKSAPRSKFEEEPETEEAVKQRKRNLGKRFSPGDGQLDYTLSKFISNSRTIRIQADGTKRAAEPEPFRDPVSLEFIFPDFPRFKPNLSPQEILRRGAFDGGYFRPVQSQKTGRELHEDWNDLPFDDWLKGLDTSMVSI